MFKRSLMKYTIDQNFDCIELHLESLFEAAAHFSTIWIIPGVIEHILHRPSPPGQLSVYISDKKHSTALSSEVDPRWISVSQ